MVYEIVCVIFWVRGIIILNIVLFVGNIILNFVFYSFNKCEFFFYGI